MADLLTIMTGAAFWAATLRIATPLVFGTLGELVCERAGVINLGIEGIMTLGALTGWMTVYLGYGLWTGVLVVALAGAAIGLVHGVLTVSLAVSQHVAGIGISLLGTSLSYYLFRLLVPQVATPTIVPFQTVPIPGLAAIPFLGPALFQQPALTYVAVLAVAATAAILYGTPLGLAVRMSGENPAAVEAQGISVVAIRLAALAAGSALMAVGGAFLTLSAFNAFNFNLVNGRGWICIALTVFSSWRPHKALVGALIFAGADSLQLRLQQVTTGVPYQLFLMLPYVLSLVVLTISSRRQHYPRALMVPYLKGSR